MKVNPQILEWARSTAGLSPDEAARVIGFKDTLARTALQRLKAMEGGDEEISRSVLLKMAKAYHRPLLVFYLNAPPRIGDRGQDFRTVPGAAAPRYNPLLDALIRDIRARQAIVRAVAQETEAQPLDFIGTANLNTPARDLAAIIAKRLNFSQQEFRGQNSADNAFNYLRRKIESAGIYVLLLGNLGSHHTNIPVEIFRGFAIADSIAPFIVINDQDARTAWSFTALHEVAHLWLGATGVSGESTDTQIEKYCNDVAGEMLLPAIEMRALRDVRAMAFHDAVGTIAAFAAARNVSRDMVAYKLLRTSLIPERTWHDLTRYFREERQALREREPEVEREGGPSYYVVRRHRLGNALLDFVRRSLGEGAITHTKAGQVLGVKPRNVDPLLQGVSNEGSR
jgi:Zn-dependent peptidase ImmA (M78 family)